MGDGNDKSDIERYIKEINMDDCAFCLGAIYDRKLVRTFFSRADLFLFPSVYDTSGLVVKEAAACACPSLLIEAPPLLKVLRMDFRDFSQRNRRILRKYNYICC